MSPSAQDVTSEVIREAVHCLDGCMAKIAHCVEQLSEEQIWWRPDPEMNSVGNLMLHLAGNLRQWVIAGLCGSEDTRNRPAEFAARAALSKRELLRKLQDTVDEAKSVLRNATAEQMQIPRRIQGFPLTGWGAIFDSLPHFQGHTQEITCLTRQQLGGDYQFHWQPQTPEQGAPTP